MRNAARRVVILIEEALREYRPDLSRTINQLGGSSVAPAAGGGARGTVALSDDDPPAPGTPAAGSSFEAARADHVHPAGPASRWEPLTNGDPDDPDLLYADGDVIMIEVAL